MAKFSITLKDPDYSVENPQGAEGDRLVNQFLEWGEYKYVTIEFDTVKKTARVVPLSEGK